MKKFRQELAADSNTCSTKSQIAKVSPANGLKIPTNPHMKTTTMMMKKTETKFVKIQLMQGTLPHRVPSIRISLL